MGEITANPEGIKYPEGLQRILTELLGTSNVYFQPPDDASMEYPCIVYHLDTVDTRYADNRPYKLSERYQITYIDYYPDMTIPDRIAQLPTAKFARHYTADNLNHYTYSLYYKEVYNNV